MKILQDNKHQQGAFRKNCKRNDLDTNGCHVLVNKIKTQQTYHRHRKRSRCEKRENTEGRTEGRTASILMYVHCITNPKKLRYFIGKVKM